MVFPFKRPSNFEWRVASPPARQFQAYLDGFDPAGLDVPMEDTASAPLLEMAEKDDEDDEDDNGDKETKTRIVERLFRDTLAQHKLEGQREALENAFPYMEPVEGEAGSSCGNRTKLAKLVYGDAAKAPFGGRFGWFSVPLLEFHMPFFGVLERAILERFSCPNIELIVSRALPRHAEEDAVAILIVAVKPGAVWNEATLEHLLFFWQHGVLMWWAASIRCQTEKDRVQGIGLGTIKDKEERTAVKRKRSKVVSPVAVMVQAHRIHVSMSMKNAPERFAEVDKAWDRYRDVSGRH
ncbi:hypothetical protein B0T16DRAFT_392877 [Cercophora newfieldiana]|uniref:Uncharacterized protein n=1 Tax=Cercophora newfieldiana TaxID=92897 RepID=A0AA39Y3R2_9PEZI|nr:hypothetical protein B0T16DRAFT_392877 [Cercophora newfieldiana]